MKINLGIIGAGLIGKKRALTLPRGMNLKVICDVDSLKGKQFAKEFDCQYERDWKKVVKNKDIEAILVCVTNNFLSLIAISAIEEKKHVLIEKPGGISANDIRRTLDAHKKNPGVVMYGYNHRLHPAIQKAKKLVTSKKYGKVLFIRAKYGHGGRVGYEKEWRFKKEISGGGELIDQGCHLIDLVNYFCGPMDQLTGYLGTMFWKTNLEDTAFFILKNKNQMASLSVSCVEWKNIFQFEVMLQTAKIQIDGLGKSYGQEKLTLYKMKPKMGPPDVEEFMFTEEDKSWEKENELFYKKIIDSDFSDTSILDSLYVLDIIGELYKIK